MRLFPPPIEIADHEGFTKEKDIFGREHLGRGLTNIVHSISDPLVIALDGQWGTGKTVFLKMWAGSLRNEGFPVIYFDAFANDYIDDAFTALAAEIVALANEMDRAPATKQFVKKAVGASKVLLRGGIKVGVKLATLGALEATDLGNIAEDVADEMSDIADDIVGKSITEKREQEDVLTDFRVALSALPVLLANGGATKVKRTPKEKDTDEANGQATAAKPLIFIIDELDRCRPLFALEILERIKHFFNVPNVHFVLGTHLQQLTNSVVITYGPRIDAETYLQKFIHLQIHLTDNVRHNHERTATKFIEHLKRVMEFRPEDREVWQYALEYIVDFADNHDLSLRSIEKIVSTLAISLAFTNKNYFRPSPLIAGLCLMKVLDSGLFVKAKRGVLSYDEANAFLKFKSVDEDFFSSWWAYSLQKSPKQELLQRFQDVEFRYHLDRGRLVPFVANEIIDRLLPIEGRG